MFDLSMAEIGVIGVVALLVLGPERLPKAARTLGFYVRKARQSWYSVRSEFERELAAEELKRSLKLDEVHATLEGTAKDLRRDIAETGASLAAAGAELGTALSATSGADPLPAALQREPAAADSDDLGGLSPEELARQGEAVSEATPGSVDGVDGVSARNTADTDAATAQPASEETGPVPDAVRTADQPRPERHA
jgi:sec-independent protein translocase protein TatB